MNKFGIFESEIFGPIISFNYIDIIKDKNISIGFFYTRNPIDHVFAYNSIYIDDDNDIKDCPTKMIRLSLLEKKLIQNIPKDSYPRIWDLTEDEKDIIFKSIRDNWNRTIHKIRYLQGNTRIVYPEKSPY